jgi:hypothetical protein
MSLSSVKSETALRSRASPGLQPTELALPSRIKHPQGITSDSLDSITSRIEVPHLINAEPPRPHIEAIRIIDMSSSNSWAEFAALFRDTRNAFLDHERAKSELKALIPEDAKEAIGHGVRAKRSKSGAISFDLLEMETSHAPLQ